jgi:hypothetical protein
MEDGRFEEARQETDPLSHWNRRRFRVRWRAKLKSMREKLHFTKVNKNLDWLNSSKVTAGSLRQIEPDLSGLTGVHSS